MSDNDKHSWVPAAIGAGVGILTSAVAFIGAIVVGFVGLGGSLVVAQSQTSAAHDADVRATRVAAYSDYVARNYEYNEFIFANLYWTDPALDEEERDAGIAGFRARAATLQAELDSSYAVVRLVAGDDDTVPILLKIRGLQTSAVLHFKCESGIQKDGCAEGTFDDGTPIPINLSSHDEIVKDLDAWGIESGKEIEKMMVIASQQLK